MSEGSDSLPPTPMDETAEEAPPAKMFRVQYAMPTAEVPRRSFTAKLLSEGRKINQDNWASSELSALYTLIKQFGTNDSALEFISACGLNRSYEEISMKVKEIRELTVEAKADRLNRLKRKYEELGSNSPKEVLAELPIPTLQKHIHSHWISATLCMTGQFRRFNHTGVKNAITDVLTDQLPNEVKQDVPVSDSVMARQEARSRMNIDYSMIKHFLTSSIYASNPTSDLNPLESSVLLNVMDELWHESRDLTNWKQKSQLRGFFSNISKKSFKDSLHAFPDYPCDELSSTQMYLDPLRTRDLGIPVNARKITRDDVDAFRSNAFEDGNYESGEEDQAGDIPVVQIEPSEVASSRYPPGSFTGMHSLPVMDPLRNAAIYVATQHEEIDAEELLRQL